MRAKKNNLPRTFQINVDVLCVLDEYSENSLFSKSAIVENALREYFKNHNVSGANSLSDK